MQSPQRKAQRSGGSLPYIHQRVASAKKKTLVKSLAQVGLDAELSSPDGVVIQIALHKVFEIDSDKAMQPFTYRSAAHVEKKQAKKSVARCC